MVLHVVPEGLAATSAAVEAIAATLAAAHASAAPLITAVVPLYDGPGVAASRGGTEHAGQPA